MTKVKRTPEQEKLIELWMGKVADFFSRYPTAYPAWVERQRSARVRELWALLNEKDLNPGKVFYLFGGEQIPTAKFIHHFWFRAAWRELVHEDPIKRVITAKALAPIFGLKPGTYPDLVKREKAWVQREVAKPSSSSVIGKMLEYPDLTEMVNALTKLIASRIVPV